MRLPFCFLACSILLSGVGIAKEPSSNDEKGIRFFESKVRPLLVKHCYKCHGAKEQESNLRLDSLVGMIRGGESGPAVIAGDVKQSLLLVAVSHANPDLQMPPDEKLPEREIADLRRWIEMGAPHPDRDAGAPVAPRAVDLETGREFWSFQPVRDPPVPAIIKVDWANSPLDHFVLALLESRGLQPAKRADKRTLIRRATFDLIGLPPTPAEIDAFLADESPRAFATVVDRLLSSPHYGERWGRHWLDVARYADSNGLDENIAHGNAWRYRDYVIAAFNKDKPYDQFLIEQLAGDLLPATGEAAVKHERLIATGFLSLGPKVLAEVDETKMEMDIVDEQVDTVGRSLMGLTMGCARCHDHKFDPIRQDDYYALAGIFKSTRTMEHFTKIARWWENPIPTEADLARKSAHERQVADQKKSVEEFIARANDELKSKSESGSLPAKPEEHYPSETKTELKKLRDALAALEKSPPAMSTAIGVTDGSVTDVELHIRGSHLTLGHLVPRGFPAVLAGEDQPLIESGSGRMQLAQWLTDADHPLTSRVMVNRIWRWHFGQGLVASTDNFGQLGDRPVNPQLLDWLARRFVESEWSIKEMHRLIMLSSTYQMSSAHHARNAAIDPENRLQWRANVRRLEAEAIRDSVLSVAGMLDTSMGGSLLHVENRKFFFDHTSKDETNYDTRKRSVYLPVVRNHLYDVFQLFDYSDASVANGNRSTTTVAPQALFMMNSELVGQAADRMAESLLGDGSMNDQQRLQKLYRDAYGRLPSEDELARGRQFLADVSTAMKTSEPNKAARKLKCWAALCHTLVAANEFVYVR